MPALADTPSPATPPRRAGWKNTLWSILGVLMFAGMLAAAAIWTVPVLLTDWQVHDAARPAVDGRVEKGRCDSRIVFHICDATLSTGTKSGRITRSVNYVFTDLHFGSYTVTVMADPARPELMTTDLALDRLWNRTVTLLVVAALLLALTLSPIVGFVRRRQGT